MRGAGDAAAELGDGAAVEQRAARVDVGEEAGPGPDRLCSQPWTSTLPSASGRGMVVWDQSLIPTSIPQRSAPDGEYARTNGRLGFPFSGASGVPEVRMVCGAAPPATTRRPRSAVAMRSPLAPAATPRSRSSSGPPPVATHSTSPAGEKRARKKSTLATWGPGTDVAWWLGPKRVAPSKLRRHRDGLELRPERGSGTDQPVGLAVRVQARDEDLPAQLRGPGGETACRS